MTQSILELEMKIMEMTAELRQLRRELPGQVVSNYEFDTLDGKRTLRNLFAGHNKLLVIHNMGQAC